MKAETLELLQIRAQQEQQQRDAWETEANESQSLYHQRAVALGFEQEEEKDAKTEEN